MRKRYRSPKIGWEIVTGGLVSVLLMFYVLLQLPGWQLLALIGAFIPILAGWSIARTRSITGRVDSEADACRERMDEPERQVAGLTVAQPELHGKIAKLDRAEESLSRQNAYLKALHRTTLGIIGRFDLDDLLQAIVKSASQLVGAQHGFLHLSASFMSGEYDPDDLTVDCRVGIGSFHQYEGYHMEAPRGVSAVVWETQEALNVDDYDAWKGRSPDVRPGLVQAVMVAPLKSGDHVVGVIGLAHSAESGRTFDSEEVEILGHFAELASIALDNSRLYMARERLITDLDAFAHTVAHDLKGLLAMIVGYGEVLLNDLREQSAHELVSMVASIVRVGYKMSDVLDELIALASVRRQRVRLGPFDMGQVVSEAEERVRGLVEERCAKIVKPDGWPEVLGYGPWVEEVWTNYLSNAVKYGGRPDEGIPPYIEIGFDEQYKVRDVRFWVRDNGRGIPPEDQERLFTPFTRLEGARVQGHGLGLSIVKRIVEKLDGEVGVTSAPGEGSVFSFTLPVAST
jgi:signal transduction histidine kinase